MKPLPRTSTVVALARRVVACNYDASELGPILADALQDEGYDDGVFLNLLRDGKLRAFGEEAVASVLVPEELSGMDWRHAFAYAGEPNAGDGCANVSPAKPGDAIDCPPFSRWDVRQVLGTCDGENDGKNWLAYGQLHDGRFFFLSAGCDYTGWG